MSSSRRRIAAAAFVPLLLAALALAGCGGGGGDSVAAVPTLGGTPIPTVSEVPLPTPACDPPAPIALPADFPAEMPRPPEYVVWELSRSPHLHVVGRATPPPDATLSTEGVVLGAFLDQINGKGWKLKLNPHIDGADYDFTTPDGKQGHFNINITTCPQEAQIIYDFFWITG